MVSRLAFFLAIPRRTRLLLKDKSKLQKELDIIKAKISKAELRNLVYGDDVITLLQDGLYKVIAGLTTTDEVIKLVEADDELNAETKVKHTINIQNNQQI